MINPFIHGRALEPHEFVERERELRQLKSLLANRAPIALVGQARVGKTSLLNYIVDSAANATDRSSRTEGFIFSLVDAQALGGTTSQAEFWEQALMPLVQSLRTDQRLTHISSLYEIARNNRFGTFMLEQLFKAVAAGGSRVVLILDEFDAYLSHPILHSAEFYGGLRSLSSRCPGLGLVISSRTELDELNLRTVDYNPLGSPYFNTFTLVRLGVLSQTAFDKLMRRGDGSLDRRDKDYVASVSGRHPYLAQAAAALLWDAHEEGLRSTERYRAVGSGLKDQTTQHFADIWRRWSHATRKVVTVVALRQIPMLLGQRQFDTGELADRQDDYTQELTKLKTDGLVTEPSPGEWAVNQGAFLWWLADELRSHVRDDADFHKWLVAHEIDGLLTHGERVRIGEATKSVLSALGKGASALIESLAKGFGEASVRAMHLGGPKGDAASE